MRALAILVPLALILAGCVEEPVEPQALEDVRTDEASLRPVEETFSGTASATPAQPARHEFTFQVPSGAVGVNATLTWEPAPGQRLRLEILDQRGELAAKGWQEEDGRVSAATQDPPRPGEWTFVVHTTFAVNVPFELTARAELIVPESNVVRKSVDLGPASFYEVNLIMEKDANFTFTFESEQPVRWDIHSHPEGGVKIWDEGEGTSANVTFTAPERGTYSILWENLNPTTNPLRFEVVGKFRIHSHGG